MSRACCTLGQSAVSPVLRPFGQLAPQRRPSTRRITPRAQNDPGKVVREFSEETGKTLESAKNSAAKGRVKDNVSPGMKQKLRDEYLGLGGSPEQPLKVNYFVVISVVIASLAILSKLAGYI